jgi:hypothetical protein
VGKSSMPLLAIDFTNILPSGKSYKITALECKDKKREKDEHDRIKEKLS